MPVHVQMEGERMRIDFSGKISMPDMWQLLETVTAIETALGRAPDRIADLTKAEGIEFSFSSMARITETRIRTEIPNPVKSAIVVGQPVQFGFARMLQTLNQHPKITVEIFRDRAAAEAWLSGSPAPEREPVI